MGHKTVTLFQGASKIPLHTTLRMAGDGTQTHHVRVPRVKWVPVAARNIIQAYLNMVDWRHIQTGGLQGDTKDWSTSPNFIQWQEHQTAKAIPSPEARELIRSLIYEPPSPILLEGLEEVKRLLKEGTPVSWIQKTLEEELIMGGGTVPTGTYASTPRASNGMGPTKPSPSRSTETGRR